jgi:TolA-binding protein
MAKDFEKAARYFMSVAILYDDGGTTPECLYEAAMAYGSSGNRDAFRKTIEELRQKYPESPWTKKLSGGEQTPPK